MNSRVRGGVAIRDLNSLFEVASGKFGREMFAIREWEEGEERKREMGENWKEESGELHGNWTGMGEEGEWVLGRKGRMEKRENREGVGGSSRGESRWGKIGKEVGREMEGNRDGGDGEVGIRRGWTGRWPMG